MLKLNLQLFAYSGDSIVDYLKSVGQDSSMTARKKLAADAGITNYSGTSGQNTKLLNTLRNGSANNTNGSGNVKNNDAKNTGKVDEPKSKYNVGGVTDDLMDKAYNNEFKVSDGQKELDDRLKNQGDVIGGLVNKANNGGIIDSGTMATINSSFSPSSAYLEAMRYTNELLAKLSSGRTSYTDQVESMMNKIMNREDFEYDVDSDQLFQQALASAMNSGKSAMQDTIGQASALTGGYGSTYATSAGNQAYNAFIEDAYNNLPEYYQMALQAYQMEGEEMFNQLGMFVDADNREYQRTYDAWSANFANADSMYNREYGAWQDSVQNALGYANLQLNEFGTIFDANSKLYDVYGDAANTQYQREYQSWADSISQAQGLVSTLNSNFITDRNFDYQKGRDAVADAQWEKQYALDEKYTNAQIAKMNSSGSGGSGGSGGGGKKSDIKSPTTAQINGAKNAFENLGIDGYVDYLESLPDNVNIDELDAIVGSESNLGMYYNTYTKTKDTFNWFWGVDNNDKVTDQDGKEYKVKEMPKDVQKLLTDAPEGATVEWDEVKRKWVIR
ncbi:MAG: hypothetical protein J6V23_07085 [Bacteroidaceae bacterium]|nr:hypothetical protein [Bacteroidaceae bacterium]